MKKKSFEELGIPPIYYPHSAYFVISGYSPVHMKRCLLGLYNDKSRAVAAAICLKDHFNYFDVRVFGVDINSIGPVYI